MNKLIKIEGELTEVNSPAYKLNVEAAKQGISLSEYIKRTLTKHAEKLKPS